MSGRKETSALGRVAQSLGILALLVLLVGLGWFLGFYYSCYGYELEEWQDFSVGYNQETGRAFLGVYHWDGREETMDIPLPDDVLDCRVTALGGYFGRGVPVPFTVELPESLGRVQEGFGEELWEDVLEANPDAEVVELPFTARVGRNLRKVEMARVTNMRVEAPDGREVLYHITLSVDCDPRNRKFYAEEGVLYQRLTGVAVLGTMRETP